MTFAHWKVDEECQNLTLLFFLIKGKDFSMKKLYMTFIVALVAICANAQVYLGGNVGIANVDNGDNSDDQTIYRLLPEIGYKFNKDWAAGVSFGWSRDYISTKKVNTFEFNPYARYTFLHGKTVNVFCDGGFNYKHYNGYDDVYSIGLQPGVELKLDKFSFIARIGFIGYAKDDNSDTSVWGMNFDGNNISLGVYYNF